MLGSLGKIVFGFLLARLETLASGSQETQKDISPRLLRTHGVQDAALEIDMGGAILRSRNRLPEDAALRSDASVNVENDNAEPTRVFFKGTYVDVEDGHASHASPVHLKYEKFVGSYDLCMTVADTSSVLNSTLVLKTCVDGDNKFLFEPPLPNQSGMIRWAEDSTKCLINRDGWLGNGNEVVMHNCDDAASTQDMTFYHARLDNSSSFWWTNNASVVPTKILEIDTHGEQYPDPSNPDMVVLWDADCGATWIVK
mmetsp:Transcript_85644/g.135227  ORF Transcript_85644/g.135227 Transcript_85644/m.135227 type:complete len:255 (-) Transcript_85644:12-776(-)